MLQGFKKPWTPQSYRNLLFSGGHSSQDRRAALPSPLDVGAEAMEEHVQGHTKYGPRVLRAHSDSAGFQFKRQPGSHCHTDLRSHDASAHLSKKGFTFATLNNSAEEKLGMGPCPAPLPHPTETKPSTPAARSYLPHPRDSTGFTRKQSKLICSKTLPPRLHSHPPSRAGDPGALLPRSSRRAPHRSIPTASSEQQLSRLPSHPSPEAGKRLRPSTRTLQHAAAPG